MLRTTIVSLFALTPFVGAAITVSSYSHSPNPHGSYPDSGNQELTDGVAVVPTWGTEAFFPGPTAPFVGWLTTNGSTTFTFDDTYTVGSVTVWVSDSDGVAGVAVPESITVSDPNSSFTQTVNVTNPAGSNNMVPITLNGFAVTTNQLEVSFIRDPFNSWTMLTEVAFAPVPEPSTAGLFMVASALLFRRKRS